jgi:hypothetical protein
MVLFDRNEACNGVLNTTVFTTTSLWVVVDLGHRMMETDTLCDRPPFLWWSWHVVKGDTVPQTGAMPLECVNTWGAANRCFIQGQGWSHKGLQRPCNVKACRCTRFVVIVRSGKLEAVRLLYFGYVIQISTCVTVGCAVTRAVTGDRLTLDSPVVTICTTFFNILKLYILPTQCICVFRMVLTVNSDCFPQQH